MSTGTPVQFGWKRAAAVGMRFRPVADADDELFVGRVYASVRKEGLAGVPWSDVQKAAFLLLQFRAEQAFLQQEYPEADWLVISGGDIDIGRLYLDCEPEDEHRIIDLALLPPFRGRGAGKALLRDLMDEAAAAGKALSAEVDKQNPAMRLFSRLGFEVAENRGERNLMRWTAA